MVHRNYSKKLRQVPFQDDVLDKFLKFLILINPLRNQIKEILAKKPYVKIKLDIKQQQQRKFLLPLNFGMDICKTVSRSVAGNQAKKRSTCITLNVCFVFSPCSIAVPTFSSRCLKKSEMQWDTSWEYFSARHMPDRCISTVTILRTNQRFSQNNLEIQ